MVADAATALLLALEPPEEEVLKLGPRALGNEPGAPPAAAIGNEMLLSTRNPPDLRAGSMTEGLFAPVGFALLCWVLWWTTSGSQSVVYFSGSTQD